MEDKITPIKQHYNLHDFVTGCGRAVKKAGKQYMTLCWHHDEDTPSLAIFADGAKYKCFGCGKTGDVIDACIALKGMDKKEAINWMYKNMGGTPAPAQPTPKPIKAPDFITPVPDDAPPPPNPAKNETRYEYRTIQGDLLGYACRFDNKNAKKQFKPLFYYPDGWKFKGAMPQKPLYRAELLSGNEHDVMIVEGEKAADAGNKLFNIPVLTWMGGTASAASANVELLRGRRVGLIPDNDNPGRAAMEKLAERLSRVDCEIKVFQHPQGTPKKWDIADKVPGGYTDIYKYMEGNFKAWEESENTKEPLTDELPTPPASKKDPKFSFSCLGYTKNEHGTNEYYIYSSKARQVITLTPSRMNKTHYMQIADISEFERELGEDCKDNHIAAYIANTCYKRGVYDANRIRGIGAWIDDKRTVIHSGDHLIVDGNRVTLSEMARQGTKFIYEADKPFDIDIDKPHQKVEANKLLQVMQLANWEKNVYAHLLAGWCVVAPVCGALSWRPHVWLTGGASTGKSSIVGYMGKMIGKLALIIQGNSTEAGIRQELGCNARPVLFDEIDSDGKQDAARIQTILSLARTTSTGDGGEVVKGQSAGKAKSFRLRSCFAFSSISPSVSNAADMSRITILSLKRVDDERVRKPRWAKMSELMAETLQPGWVTRLQSRTIKMLPTILSNAQVFSSAVIAVTGEQRAGDQLGIMLAGAYSLASDGLINFENAKKWCESQSMTELYEVESDENSLIGTLLQQTEQIDDNGAKITRSIAELIEAANAMYPDGITSASAKDWLIRCGIKVSKGRVYFASNSDWIKKRLQGTQFEKGWLRVIERVEGAQKEGATRFGVIISRAVSLPVSTLISADNSEANGANEGEKRLKFSQNDQDNIPF